jgi:hypothetical protein
MSSNNKRSRLDDDDDEEEDNEQDDEAIIDNNNDSDVEFVGVTPTQHLNLHHTTTNSSSSSTTTTTTPAITKTIPNLIQNILHPTTTMFPLNESINNLAKQIQKSYVNLEQFVAHPNLNDVIQKLNEYLHRTNTTEQHDAIVFIYSITMAANGGTVQQREHVYDLISDKLIVPLLQVANNNNYQQNVYSSSPSQHQLYRISSIIQNLIGGDRFYYRNNYYRRPPPISMHILNRCKENGLLQCVISGKLPCECIVACTICGYAQGEDRQRDTSSTATFLYRICGMMPPNDDNHPTEMTSWLVKSDVAGLLRYLIHTFSNLDEVFGDVLGALHHCFALSIICIVKIYDSLGGNDSIDALAFLASLLRDGLEVNNVLSFYNGEDWDFEVYGGAQISDDEEEDHDHDNNNIGVVAEAPDILDDPDVVITKMERCRRYFIDNFEGDDGLSARDSIYINRVRFVLVNILRVAEGAKEKIQQIQTKTGKNANKVV